MRHSVTGKRSDLFRWKPRSKHSRQRTSASRDAEKLLAALRAWATSVMNRPPEGQEIQACDASSPDRCQDIGALANPEHVVHFRQAVEAVELDVSAGDGIEQMPEARIGCIPTPELSASICFDLRYQQRWVYQQTSLGALSASVALAPNETLSLSVRNLQRTQFERETIDETETSRQTENLSSSTDVMNVTGSSTRTSNWQVNGNASITLPKWNAGINASTGGSLTTASSTSATHTSATTSKTATNLKTLNKVVVKQTTENTTETTSSRKIENPYRDRSLRLDVYGLVKDYCVEFALTEIVPILEIDPGRLNFDRDFILRNGDFLAIELTDQSLQFELADALQVTTALREQDYTKHAREIALMALDGLYGSKPIMNFPVPWPGPLTVPTTGEEIRPANWDENDAQGSFKEPLKSWSAAQQTIMSGPFFSQIFTTLAFFNRLYQDEVIGNNKEEFAVEIALALDSSITTDLAEVTQDDMRKLADWDKATEVFRRLPGFLSMTSGILKPLLQPAEQEQEQKRAADRAGWVLDRVVAHLSCHRRYYTERYFLYLGRQTNMRSVSVFIENVIENNLPELGSAWNNIFDAVSAFLDGAKIVVPLRVSATDTALQELLKGLEVSAPALGILRTDKISLPSDGVHIEPAAGGCILADVPDRPSVGPIHIVLQEATAEG